ncbi:hypothetical protein DPMN_053288 [Dreissena polymorpha]|uniref:Uncharacterized protein n=1 Tax=Dreissena polymorpha TaxID=45954 RepID=A0A9D4CL33_DREPO|nr:hypothetical protein DPMN_053288 [Dreissena polymorpha]
MQIGKVCVPTVELQCGTAMCANWGMLYTNRGTKCLPLLDLQIVPTGALFLPTEELSATITVERQFLPNPNVLLFPSK